MKRVGPFVLERRLAPSRAAVIGVSVLAVLAALLVMAIIFWGYGVSPWHAYATIAKSTLGSRYGLMEILRRTIPLLLCGVGLVIAFRSQFWNIGAEGQLLAGAVAATGVALYSGIPAPWLLPTMFVVGFLAGAVWGIIPAFLKVKLRVNDVITTLMMNYIMIYIVEWLIHGPWKGPTMRGFAYTDTFPKAAWLPTLPLSRVHWPTLVIGLVAAVLAAFILARTRLGYEIRVVGESPDAARYAGINFLRVSLWVMILSGGLAGLAGVGEVGGIHHKLLSPVQVSVGYGYTAIIVAWLARGSPIAAIMTAALFGLIFAAGDVIKVALRMPFQVTGVFNGLILFFLIGVELLMYWRVRLAPKGERWTGKAGSSES
jgi:simple sugar transport system permease protein